VPALVGSGLEPLIAWFLTGLLVFVPLLAAALIGARLALPAPSWTAMLDHLRVRRLNARGR
jgi:hypothetical protein